MQKRSTIMRYVLMILCLVWQMAYAQAAEELSPQEQRQVWQMLHKAERMYALSMNHYHGTAVEHDVSKAYAWLALYVAVLPDSYPGMQTFLKELRQELSEEQLATGRQLMAFYRDKYDLNFKLTERQLYQAYHTPMFDDIESMDEVAQTTEEESQTLPEFAQLVQQLEEAGQGSEAAELADRMHQALTQTAQNDKAQIVYGQIKIAGKHNPQFVTSTVGVTESGYFVALLDKARDSIPIHLNGYKPVTVSGDRKQGTVVNAGVVLLHKVAQTDLASLLGVFPDIKDPGQVNVVMRPVIKAVKEPAAADPFWLQQAPVVVLPSGEFFAVDLTPGQYHIQVSTHGKVVWQQTIQLKAGELRQLGDIPLLKTA
jgi:hypothetical protein